MSTIVSLVTVTVSSSPVSTVWYVNTVPGTSGKYGLFTPATKWAGSMFGAYASPPHAAARTSKPRLDRSMRPACPIAHEPMMRPKNAKRAMGCPTARWMCVDRLLGRERRRDRLRLDAERERVRHRAVAAVRTVVHADVRGEQAL